MLTGGYAGLISSAMGMGVFGIVWGARMLHNGSRDGWFGIGAGVAAIIGASIFAALSKTWRASAPEGSLVNDRGPYDGPASLSPRSQRMLRMVDPRQERPRDY